MIDKNNKIDVYLAIKGMPNPSPGLLKFFKNKARYSRVWAIGSKGQTLYHVKNMVMSQMDLKVGSPDHPITKGKSWSRGRVFDGYMSLRSSMFHGGARRNNRGYLIGPGVKDKGVFMVDVTERIIQELNRVGACAVSHAHCQFQLSPTGDLKVCKFCKRGLIKKIEVREHVKWIDR